MAWREKREPNIVIFRYGLGFDSVKLGLDLPRGAIEPKGRQLSRQVWNGYGRKNS